MMVPSFAPGEQIPQGLGLGDAPPTNFSQWPTDMLGYRIPCDVWFNWVGSPSCWKYSLGQWQAAANTASSTQGVPLNTTVYSPPPAVPAAYGTVAAPYDCSVDPTGSPSCPGYEAAVQAAINASMVQTQANIQKAVTDASAPPAGGLSSVPWYVWAALAGVGIVAMRR